jgi:hypothetical protein
MNAFGHRFEKNEVTRDEAKRKKLTKKKYTTEKKKKNNFFQRQI